MEQEHTSHHIELARSKNSSKGTRLIFSLLVFFISREYKVNIVQVFSFIYVFFFSRRFRTGLVRRKQDTNELTTKVRGALIVPVGCCVVQPAEQQQV